MPYMHIDNLTRDPSILMMRECYALEKVHGTSAHIKFDPVTEEIELFPGGVSMKQFVETLPAPTTLAVKFDLSASSLKPKDLVGIPWMVAFALRDDGWWLRSAIIWAKGWSFSGDEPPGSVMPGSYKDRPITAYEHVFLLTRSAKYYYDHVAVQEKAVYPAGTKAAKGSTERKDEAGVNARPNEYAEYTGTRELRDVWRINIKGYPLSHFACYPTELVEPCIKAGTSEWGRCSVCGNPWIRVVEKSTGGSTGKSWHDHSLDAETGNNKTESSLGYLSGKTIGWKPSCKCVQCEDEDLGGEGCTNSYPEPIPCVVLDPFFGAGTTGLVTQRLGRDCIGIDISEKYCKMVAKRLRKDAPLLSTQLRIVRT